MNSDDRLAQLERKLQYLMDRTEILDCVARHARGCDRFDSDLLTSTYHADGVDDRGHDVTPGPKYANFANAQHAVGSLQNMHHITTHSCEIDGDTAHCESYVVVLLLNSDGKTARLIGGRYVDRLERRDGAWKIALRRSSIDMLMTGEASILSSPAFRDRGYIKGMRDKRDISYQRPLTIDETPADRW